MNKTKLHLTRGTAVLIILFAAAVLAAAVVVRSMPSGVQSGLRSLVDASKAEGRQKYLSGLGWEIEPSSEQSAKIVLPEEFDGVMADYNNLQKQQGFDMSMFAGQECTQYTYAVKNYPGEDGVLATLYVHGRRVIAGDIHSTSVDGFMHTLTCTP